MTFKVTYNPDEIPYIKASSGRAKPRMAILREQGVNGHVEMAAAFALAGFESIDVHMTDLLSGRVDLTHFNGVVACGGFSYGDVLGAGSGWARSILYNDRLSAMFKRFFERPDTGDARCLQRVSDGFTAEKHYPRCAALAEIPPQYFRTV